MRTLPILFLLAVLAAPVLAETVTIEASRDATLIEDPDGALANGSGLSVFVGKTSAGGVRRGLLYFDVAGVLPREAIIEAAELIVFVNPGNDATREFRLHRVLADWSEGPSVSGGGGGAPSLPGDATWIHTSHDARFWLHSGGQFAGEPSARLDVGGPGYYVWPSTKQIVRDVRKWKSSPRRNFGWILIGEESTRQTAKKVASREDSDPMRRPVLEITYRTRGQ
jgi:hypothetical protein